MGHERLGTLPKTRKWRDIVGQIADLYTSDNEISDIVKQTTQSIGSRFRFIHRDKGVNASFKFLVALSVAARSANPKEKLSSLGIKISEDLTPFSIAKAIRAWMVTKETSLEYSQIAQGAAVDSVAIWYSQNKIKEANLFKSFDDPFEVWRKAGKGAGFCELSRIYFTKFTERYLNYFLEREASAVLHNVYERDRFYTQIQEHVEKISQYAFETAKITQSFAAGWFNKSVKDDIPNNKSIERFLSLAFKKMREELVRGE